MAEFVYPPVVLAAKTLFRVMDYRIDVQGTEHIPATGGAVIACNHVSYLDFIFCGFGAQPAKRLVRFMAKEAIFRNAVAGPLMRGMHHISVDRSAGQASYQEALAKLKAGEVVGVFPEATISRSFTVKELKSGSARLAAEAGVPLIPMALWGTQRLWTKGRPRDMGQRHVPISILTGAPIEVPPDADLDAVTADLRVKMTALVDRLQKDYPDQEPGAWWLPAHLGGTAPTLEEAAELEARKPE
ncbi:1-acyl-sn-glycerol-3-phosphate acyltransferase [Actinokineospora spheciospongiae]|uniref:1-acyl-sn-glycerol-3-phosphate acyltransferase n=1 Tax=Actinokineospora spheciospongiae TaxID=909613 RepID=W7IY20_9PSEU|nr:lysophospholipid acyltransferase family protein [Actinokineospora spheciospongiae]EWC61762.1 1-acyl-sn-glycerol-3-phosphate acyltransferase [Actinokineospora spheciospongiae]